MRIEKSPFKHHSSKCHKQGRPGDSKRQTKQKQDVCIVSSVSSKYLVITKGSREKLTAEDPSRHHFSRALNVNHVRNT